ncbi:MAG: YhbY family RNA-binding protein [Pseudomonadota bacterium]
MSKNQDGQAIDNFGNDSNGNSNVDETSPIPRFDSRQLRQMRAAGHQLSPVLTVAGNGLSDNVLLELDRALNDHELIKVKLAVGSRELREATLKQLLDESRSSLVQRVGNVALIVRRSAQPDPRKSNLLRTLANPL